MSTIAHHTMAWRSILDQQGDQGPPSLPELLDRPLLLAEGAPVVLLDPQAHAALQERCHDMSGLN